MEALESQWESLSLTEEERVPITVDEDPSELDKVKSRMSLLG